MSIRSLIRLSLLSVILAAAVAAIVPRSAAALTANDYPAGVRATHPDCPPVAFIRRQAGGLRGTNATMHGGHDGRGFGDLHLRSGSAAASVRTIFDSPDGFIFDMSLSFDARRLAFAFKTEVVKRQDSFHIYEIGVDGRGLRQITAGPYHDFSPAYLPDGRIVFNSTRVESYSLCQNFLAAALHVVDADGRNLRRLEYNTLCDTTPYVQDDGTILFSRWEYQDKKHLLHPGPLDDQPGRHADPTLLRQHAHRAKLDLRGQADSRHAQSAVRDGRPSPSAAGGHRHRRPESGHRKPRAMTNLTPEVPYVPTIGRTCARYELGAGRSLLSLVIHRSLAARRAPVPGFLRRTARRRPAGATGCVS